MEFYLVTAKQGPQFYQGELAPYPPDLVRFYTDVTYQPECHIAIRGGTQQGDMVFAAFNCVSARFVGALARCGATGFVPVRIPLIQRGSILGDYYYLKVTGVGGAFDVARSRAKLSESGVVLGHSGVYMKESEWDGSDMFFIPGLGISLCVTYRVYTALLTARMRNVRLTPNSECQM